MSSQLISFADIAHSHLSFCTTNPTHQVVLSLIDTPWFQRLRDISQTAHTRLVYMFSEHSRFGHSLGVAYLADLVIKSLLESTDDDSVKDEINYYAPAVILSALLHDIGHLAPGSHAAWKAWFPKLKDDHECLGIRIINECESFNRLFSTLRVGLKDEIIEVLSMDPKLPPWTWQIISGGGWNVDRGNWCLVDSILAGVNYGKYNISAITESLEVNQEHRLSFRENRLDAMAHFAVSRHALYRQVYHHRVLLAADALLQKTVQRARDVSPLFADNAMREILTSDSYESLSLDTVFNMRESWWQYHLSQWRNDPDQTLRDLASRLQNRRLFKTIRILDSDNELELIGQAQLICKELHLDPRYYVAILSTPPGLSDPIEESLVVKSDSGAYKSLVEMDDIFSALSSTSLRRWLAVPSEVKDALNRVR